MTELDKLRNRRRGQKAALTRNLGVLQTRLGEDGVEKHKETIRELAKRADEAYEAVEETHQKMGELLDDDNFLEEEKWIQVCQADFWLVKDKVNHYLNDENKDIVNVNETSVSSVNNDVDLTELRLALELPKAHIEEFNGDPVSYWSFMNNFKTNVAAKLSTDGARLQYLLQLCEGKARKCIESCAWLESGGYKTALEVLRKQFGQPHMILSCLMRDLVERRRISAGDGDALLSLVSAMKKCQITLTQMGYVNDLNSTSNLLKVQSLLPTPIQCAWADKANELLKSREPTFTDMTEFLEKKAEISCNMFARI